MKNDHRSPLRLFKRRMRHSWQAATGKTLQPPKWVFVLGCYNSGTTLLVNLLQAHPALAGLPREGVELTDRLPRPEQFGWPRLWQPCREMLEVDGSASAAGDALRIKKQWSHYVDDNLLIVEKSPANLLRLEFLQAHFAPAYFIYIVRNGYAVAEGIRRKADPAGWGNKEVATYPIDACAAQWADADAVLEAHAAKLENLLRISYEALTDDVAGTLATISRFLQIDDFADDLGRQRWVIHRREAEIADMNRDAISRLSAQEIAAVERAAGATLQKYAYQAV